MSGNQSRFEKSEYRKPSRPGNSSGTYQRSYVNKNSAGAGGGSGPPHPPVSSHRGACSFKETNNVQGGQSAVNLPPNVVAPSRTQHNRVANQPPIHGPSVTAAGEISSQAHESSSSQRSHRDVPKAPSSQSAAMSTPAKSPTIPVKEEAPKPIAVQFGSISPGFINGMQIPARTSSAPPNLDEQKRNQARMGSFQAVPTVPVPAVPKQQLPEKEAGISKQVHGMDPHSVSRAKKEPRVSPATSSSLPQKPPTIPSGGIPMQVPFLQQQVHLPYGVANQPIQPQGVPGASMHIPLPMHYPMGNAPQLHNQIFMPNIQPNPMQHQGMMHQGQGMSFNAQIGPRISHQFGNLGMNMPPRYATQRPPHQTGNFSAPRKAVVITHPDTREELKLDKRGDKFGDGGLPGSRSHPNAPVNKLQINSSNTSGPASHFYPNSVNSSSYFVPTSSLSANVQRTPNSHAPRINPVSQGPHASGFGVPSIGSKVPLLVSAPSGLVKAEPGNDTQVEGYAISVNGDSPKLGGQGDAKPKKVAVDSNEISINVSQDSKSSVEVSTVPGSPPAVGTTQYSASCKVSVEGIHDDSATNPQRKLKEKGSAQDQPQGSTHSAATPYPLGIVNDSKASVTDTAGNLDKSDISSSKTFVEKSSSGTEPSYGHDTTQGSSLSNELKERSQISHSVDDNIQQKPELPAYIASETQEGSTDIASDVGTYEKFNRLPRTDSKHSDLDKSENGMPVDKLASEAVASSDSVAPESSPCSDQGSHTNAIAATHNEPTIKSVIPDSDLILGNDGGDDKNIVASVTSLPVTGSKDKTVADQNKPKSASSKGKKKLKELLQKADAAGSTFDLYNAYKAPEEHKEMDLSPESEETGTMISKVTMMPDNTITEDSNIRETGSGSKGEPDDWEDAADVATPEAGAPDNSERHEELKPHNSQSLTKKYSRDFLLKFQSQNYNLPEGFSIAPNVASVLLTSNANKGHLDQNSYPSPGRHTGGSRSDRYGAADDDNRSKVQGHFVHNRDNVNSAGGFRSVQGGNSGVLRHPRQAPGQFPGVNHAGPPQSINAMHRNNTEADRWQRGSNFQKGLFPSPQTPTQMMHKAEKKYELGKAADEEQAKQRKLKAILNKLTPQNFEKLFEQVKAVNIDSAVTLTGVISQIFDKALMEPTFCEMYADFCCHLSGELPDFNKENEKITFKRVLLNKCQEEFEKGEREQEEANKPEDSEITLTKQEREERRVLARRRMLGNIRFIGELFKKKMLTERIMHECIKKLLGQHENQDEEDLEALCKLMSTIGEMIDHPVAKPFMDAYYEMMGKLSNDMNLSSRVRFMLKDAIDLRKNNWQQRRKIEGPKKIDEVHRDAAQERQAQANRLARGPGSASGRRAPPQEFGSRGSNNSMSSANSHTSNFRGHPSHSRGMGNQDIHSQDRYSSFDSRTLSIPLKTIRDDSLTLGPQGGLARGMSNMGSTPLSSALLRDRPLSSGESRRTELGHNGINSMTERPTSSSSDDAVGRSASERYTTSATHGRQDRNMPSDRDTRNVGSSFDKASKTSPGNTFSTDQLHDMSLAAIKEFYSAKDEKEVILCINDLNSPSCYPSMVALWVTDSFERKDMHRDLLTRLLINLSKPPSGILSQQDLLKGFESVLATLEDAVNDAPRAPEFLGHILAKSIVENVIHLADISSILHAGGEEPGTLLECGLAGDVLGIILEAIQADKGDSIMKQILSSANLQLEDFRPPGPIKSKKLEKFIS